VDLRAGLDDAEKRKFLTLLGLELRPLGRPAHSQSLYRLCYPGSLNFVMDTFSKFFLVVSVFSHVDSLRDVISELLQV
jgi:hypothetical protein